MSNDLISRSALISAIEKGEGISWERYGDNEVCARKKYIDNAPTVELDEVIIQKVLKPRCMSVVTNEYLISLHGDPFRFTIEELRSWLYQIAINNTPSDFEKDVVEIIQRLDGFERFCKERRAGT